MRRLFIGLLAAAAVAVLSFGHDRAHAGVDCRSGYVAATIGGESKCLHAGEFCSAAHEQDYARYGFSCANRHLRAGGKSTPPAKRVKPGEVPTRTTLLAHRTRTSGCRVRGALPDRRCSPGAIYADATPAMICTPGYSARIRDVSEATKAAIFAEYGIPGAHHGSAYEVDHIVSLELGGSNAPANLYPEAAAGPSPGFHVKDRLENRLHELVCSNRMGLRHAQRGIAANWTVLYREVFGVDP